MASRKKSKDEKVKRVYIKVENENDESDKESFLASMLKPLPRLQPWPLGPKQELSVKEIRQVLSHEKIKMLHTIKKNKPVSLYALAKLLKRDFKAVMMDVKILEHCGFIELISEKDKKTNRKRIKPVANFDKIDLIVEL